MKFRMRAYTGQVLTFAWWGRLVFDISGMRLEQKFPILRQHDSLQPVGVGTTSYKADGALWAEGDLLSNSYGQEVQQLLEEGFPLQASVGIWPITVEEVASDKSVIVNGQSFKGPGMVLRESHVREISVVALGRDDKTETFEIAASAGKERGVSTFPSFEAVVSGLRASGMTVAGALCEAARKYPHLHEEYLTRKNREWREAHGREEAPLA